MRSLDDKISSLKRLLGWCPRDYKSGISVKAVGLRSGGKPQTELSVAETVSETFTLYSKNFLALLAPVLVTSLIAGALTAALSTYVIIPPRPETVNIVELTRWLIISFTTSGLISTVINAIAIGAIIKYSSDLIEDHTPTLRGALRFAGAKFLPMLAASVLIGVLSVLGVIALIAPGVILYVMFSLANEVIIIEGDGAIPAMSRSKALVRHRWLKTFTLVLAVVTVGQVASLFASLTVGLLGNSRWILSSVANALTAPLLPVALTVYYYSMHAKEQPRVEKTFKAPVERPSSAVVLSFVGGLLVLGSGLVMIRLGSFLNPIRAINGAWSVGFLALLCGVLMTLGAIMLFFMPQKNVIWGLMVLGSSFASLFCALGGLYIGFFLGFAGGILGMTWKEARGKTEKPTIAQSPPARICQNCGTSITETDAKFCPRCGRDLSEPTSH